MDHPNPDITAPEGGATGESLDGAVRDRVLRLHPLAGDGGLSGTVMRKASGWEQAGTFAAEVMGRFRSPGEVTPTAMPLATPVASSRPEGSEQVSGMAAASSPVGQGTTSTSGSSTSGRLGPGSFVQRKVVSGPDTNGSTKAAGRVAEPFPATEKLAEGFHKSSVGPDSYDRNIDVSRQLLSTPPAAGGAWAMTARLHGTLGSRLVQRHSGFAGASPEAETGVASPFSVQRMPLATGESTPPARDNKAIGRTVQRKSAGGTESGKIGIADNVSAATSAVGADLWVRPGEEGRPRGAAPTFHPNQPSPIVHPPVKPAPPAGAALQRKGGAASLADAIFARLPNPSPVAAMPFLPLPASVVASSATAMERVSSSSMTKSYGGVSPAAAASAAVVSPPPKETPSAGSASGQGPLPVIRRTQPGGGASGVVSRKSKESVTGSELSWGEPRAGGSEMAGAVFLPRTDYFSLPLPPVAANSSFSVFSAPLPLARMQGVIGSGNGGNIQRKLSDSASVMQRAETTGANTVSASSGGTSESSAAFSPGGSPETGALSPAPGASIDLERVADEVYRLIERRLIVEKENRGL